MFNLNDNIMRFISYTQTNSYYEFLCEDGTKVLMPTATTIIVNDGQTIVVKTIGSRCTVGYIVQ